jgi:hypothetical protein
MVAADYLLLDDKFKGSFFNNMAHLVALMLSRDRRNLTAANLEMVQTHQLFAAEETIGFFGELERESCGEVLKRIF